MMEAVDALRAADRAACAAAKIKVEVGRWLLVAGCHRSIEAAAAFVRAHPKAPAEALYLTLRRDKRMPWTELAPAARVSLEVFRATLLVLDTLVEPVYVVTRRARHERLAEREDGRLPGMSDRERLR
jgi:hypothetical protein